MSDIEIARKASMVPVQETGAKPGIRINNPLPFDRDEARISEGGICGGIRAMPGLPGVPAAWSVCVSDAAGSIGCSEEPAK